jgi:hypothetical protein
MRVGLFGVGLKGESPNVTAEERINCFAEIESPPDRAKIALFGTPGKTLFANLGGNPSRGVWAVNTLPTPIFFSVNGNTLSSVNNAGVSTAIGTISSTTGDVSMVDNGTYLMLVDGANGYYYNLLSGGALTQITDGNFTTTPKTVTWQDTYFIVTSGGSNQFQLSDNGTPATWPAVNINFTGSAPGNLQAGIASNSILMLFGGVYAEFWQNAGFPDFPYAVIPGSAQEFGLGAAFSLFKYDNSVAGVFRNRMGEVNISRMSGFRLERMSDFELEFILNSYTATADCKGFGYMLGGHPMAQFNFPGANRSWLYDAGSKAWTQLKQNNGDRDKGQWFCNFQNRRIVTDYGNGNIYTLDEDVYLDDGDPLPMEVTSRHLWNDDKYISVPQLQIDMQSGTGTATGQGVNPQVMLSISKDGGHTFVPHPWSGIGPIGEYTQRIIWRRLGRSRDWVFRLRITDPVFRVVTGASAEVIGGAF